MPFDVVAFLETQTATALSGVDAVEDEQYTTNLDDLFIKKEAPWLGGVLQLGVTTPKYCETRQPSLKIPYRFYKAALTTVVDHRAGLDLFWKRPLPLYADEKLNVYVQNATAEYSVVGLWLLSARTRQADIDNVSPTHRITGYADQTLTVNVWNDVAVTWDQDLPKGTYAVVGMKAGTYVAVSNPGLTRLKIQGCPWRPGVVTSEITADKTLFVNHLTAPDEKWPLMNEITFRHDRRPNVQMLSLTADEDHVFELALQKIA